MSFYPKTFFPTKGIYLMALLCLACVIVAYPQQGKVDEQPVELVKISGVSLPALANSRSDTFLLIHRSMCKLYSITAYTLRQKIRVPKEIAPALDSSPVRSPFLSIHGNVQYDFLYRSFVDTPFTQNNYQQHTVQTSLNIVVKDKYPLNVSFTTRRSNSPYFKNFFDINTRFDKQAYERKARQELLNKIESKYLQKPDLKMLEEALKKELEQYNSLNNFLKSPAVLQRLIEQREREYYKKLKAETAQHLAHPSLDSIKKLLQLPAFKMGVPNTDIALEKPLLDSNYAAFVEKRKKDLDSIQQKVTRLQTKSDSLRNSIQKELASAKQKVYKAKNLKELQQIKADNGLMEGKPKGAEAFLSNVKSIGLGRSMINYTELTAWNVSLTGLNVEYNSRLYAALAAGKIDYGFRDFFGRNTRQKGQNLLMGRIGIGDKDKKALIFSAFTGKKYSYGSVLTDTLSDHVNVAGYSVEAILKKNDHTGISAEIAKTTKPASGRFNQNQGLKSLSNFSDYTNLGVSVKGETYVQQTDTRISGFFRKTGQNFQSFSLFTYNTDQTAWLLKVDQPFLKNKIGVVGMLRRNDFTNPFTEKTFKTSTVFKSVQVNVCVPKLPALSAGYYPGSQLYMVDKERIRENAYYILNGSVVHTYAAGNMRMLSSLIYNKYSSKGTDSGFIAYKGVSYMAAQSFIFSKAQLQGSYVYTDQEQMQFYTLEAGGDYSIGKMLRIGAGAKYNRVAGGKTYIGSRAELGVETKKLGGLQLQYEKSYLPTIYQTLFPVEVGRVSWFKYF